jgi:glycosyltransferase involved in cell wall biosynthesis
VLFIAWLQQEKGVLDLLAAMPRVLRAVPEASFVVAGRGIAGGETPESLRALAARLGVEGALRLPGWVTGPAKSVLLREADLFVLPSYVEALPVGVLEAMACGVPVVATRVGGVPDVIEDGVHGLLVEPGDPEGLARAMIALLSDDALRERVQQAAHRQVQARYSTRAVLAELEALYRDLGVVLP